MEILLGRNEIYPDKADKYGRAALWWAIMPMRWRIIKLLQDREDSISRHVASPQPIEPFPTEQSEPSGPPLNGPAHLDTTASNYLFPFHLSSCHIFGGLLSILYSLAVKVFTPIDNAASLTITNVMPINKGIQSKGIGKYIMKKEILPQITFFIFIAYCYNYLILDM